MENYVQKAKNMQKEAWKVIEQTDMLAIWHSVGATINLVGSLKTGLLINNRDIDFHIYTEPFSLEQSFLAISKLAQNPNIQAIHYTNLLESEDRCIQWQAIYKDKNKNLWQIDMVHLLQDSFYAGYFEKVAARILEVLTPQTYDAILKIKNELEYDKRKIKSILIYKAVIEEGILDKDSFLKWEQENISEEIIHWIP